MLLITPVLMLLITPVLIMSGHNMAAINSTHCSPYTLPPVLILNLHCVSQLILPYTLTAHNHTGIFDKINESWIYVHLCLPVPV